MYSVTGYACGEEGHYAKQCPKPRNSAPKPNNGGNNPAVTLSDLLIFGDLMIIDFSKGSIGKPCCKTKLFETNEWEAPESNKTVAGTVLTGNVPSTMSGAFCASSLVTWFR